MARPQDDALATYAPRLTRESGRVDWTRDAREIGDRLRAYTPWPGLTAELRGEPVKLVAAGGPGGGDRRRLPAPSSGCATASGLAVACGGGSVLGVRRIAAARAQGAARRRLRQRRAPAARRALLLNASRMSKRRPPVPNQTGPARRLTPRRTPQDNVRAAAGWVLERTLQSLAPVDSFLDSALARFDERDQGLLRELVMGSLRWLRRLDHVIAAGQQPARSTRSRTALHAPLRIATYQLLFLDRVPAHAAVHEAVEQAHQLTHRGGASFVNGVLRRIARAPRLEDWPVDGARPGAAPGASR